MTRDRLLATIRDRWDPRYRADAALLGAIGDGRIELGRPGLAIHDRG